MTGREVRILAEIIGAADAARVARADDVKRRATERHARRVARDEARTADGWAVR